MSLSPAATDLHRRFVAAVEADLDMPRALAVIREALKARLADDELRWVVLDADAVLGLDLHLAWSPAPGSERDVAGADLALPAEIQDLVDARTAARAGRDFAQADALRAELLGQGYEVIDQPGSSLVRRVSG